MVSSNIGHVLLEGPLLTSHMNEMNHNKLPLPGDYVLYIDTDNNDYQTVEHMKKNMLGNMQIIAVFIHCIGKSIIIIALYTFLTFCNLDFYNVSAGYKSQSQLLQITGRSDPIILEALNATEMKLSIAAQSNISNNTLQSESNQNLQRIILDMYSMSKVWINQQENSGIILVLIIFAGCVIAAWYLYVRYKEQSQQLSQVRCLMYCVCVLWN